MKSVLAAVALATGALAWWAAAEVQAGLGLAWMGDFGQICLVIAALSALGKATGRFL